MHFIEDCHREPTLHNGCKQSLVSHSLHFVSREGVLIAFENVNEHEIEGVEQKVVLVELKIFLHIAEFIVGQHNAEIFDNIDEICDENAALEFAVLFQKMLRYDELFNKIILFFLNEMDFFLENTGSFGF